MSLEHDLHRVEAKVDFIIRALRLDFSHEAAQVIRMTEQVREAENNLPPRTNQQRTTGAT